MTSDESAYTGCLISFEGGDGSGKSTHIKFLAEALNAHGFEVLCVREPGGTSVGEKLRGIVLDVENEKLSDRAELLIYEAARAQLIDEVIKPALESGSVVLCDRFTDSTLAYQGYGRGLDMKFIEQANLFATSGITPDVTVVLSCPNREEKKNRVDRREARGEAKDRLEMAGDDFHSRVIDAFSEIANAYPERITVIETGGKHSQTALKIFDAIKSVLPGFADGSFDMTQMLADYDAAHDHSRDKDCNSTDAAADKDTR